jgi:chromosomal replication initiation ATPase DnaA
MGMAGWRTEDMVVLEALARDQARARLAAGVASFALGVGVEEILSKARGATQAAFARQIAVYLCHTSFEWSLARVALAFGRDRSTVAHACHAIEDRCDEPQFDRWLASLEAILRDAPPPAMVGAAERAP